MSINTSRFRDGTTTAPGISFLSDTDTGFWRSAANQITVITGAATSSVFNTSGIQIPSLSNTILAVNSTGQIIATSSAGASGTSGTSGVSGSSGTSGSSGAAGAIGATGSTGAAGSSGTSGSSGAVGAVGATGSTGAAGSSGTSGSSGSSPAQSLQQTLSLGNTTGTYSILYGDGSSATPSVAFTTDSNTGFYKVGFGRLGFVSNASILFTATSNETDMFQVRGFATASNNVYYHYALAQSGGSGIWKLGVESDVSTFRLDRWSASSYADTFMRVTTSTASINYRTYFSKAVNHLPITNSSVSGTYSIDMSAGNVWNLTLTGNATLTTTNQFEGSYVLLIKQDGVGGRSLSLHSDGRFIGATALSFTTSANAINVVQLVHIGTQSIVTSQKNLTTL